MDNTQARRPGGRFRYGLRTLLLVPTVFAAVLVWWVTWPRRSADRFISLMVTEPAKAAPTSGMARVLSKYEHDAPYLEPHSRSLASTLLGIQTFTVVVPVIDEKLDGHDMEFTATLFFERGHFRGPIELDSRFRKPRE
jgi:hypothetical protein